jgi:hypothetical protein
MKLRWFSFSTLALALLSTSTLAAGHAQAAATVAVMPVQGVNLTEGQSDAIGVMFANAFARETNVVVASPIETKPVLLEARTSLAAAARLGVFEYIEIAAVQLGTKTTLNGKRFSKQGGELFRAEAAANGLDDMGNAIARLARALAWPQMVPPSPSAEPVVSPYSALPPAPTGPRPYPAALGVKSGIHFPMASGKTLASMMSLQFLARIGPRGSFAEVGAGFVVPSTTASGSNAIEMGGLFAELGGGGYLSDGSIAPYLGGGVSPRIWFVDSSGTGGSTSGATCTVYGMAGVTFTRDNRAPLFGELHVSQYVVGLARESYSQTGVLVSDTFYPTELSLQVGIGW